MTIRRLRLLATLALLSVLAGCGSPAAVPLDVGPGEPDLSVPWFRDPCDEFGTVALFRITELRVPTVTDVNANVPVGHNVDRMGNTCGIPDFPGGVDNALIDLSSELLQFAPAEPLVLQSAIDAALQCPIDADPAQCTRLDLVLRVSTGVHCVRIAIEDGGGTVLAGPFVGSLDSEGNFRAEVSWFDLTIPYHAASGRVDIDLGLASVILTAHMSDGDLTDVVLGGMLVSTRFEATLMALLPLLGDEPTFDDVQPVLADLYDVELNGSCSALSVGLRGSATRLPEP